MESRYAMGGVTPGQDINTGVSPESQSFSEGKVQSYMGLN